MWQRLVLGVVTALVSGVSVAAPVNLIFDTDMDSDVDDVGALSVLHALADLNEVALLAVIHSAPQVDGPVCAQAINRWYGRESIPVGSTTWPNFESSPVYERYRNIQTALKEQGRNFTATIAAEYRGAKKDPPARPVDGVTLYRKTLAAAEDGSVVICAVGQLAALAGLIKSGPDEFSDLDGRALVAQKVRLLVTMARSEIPEGTDGFNWRCDWPSARTVVNQWPTGLAVMPLGKNILTGEPLSVHSAPENPCRRAYDIYVKQAHKSRSSWDLCAVLYAVRGTGPWFKNETGYRIQLASETGKSSWQEDPASPQILIGQVASDEAIRAILDELLIRPPVQ